MCNYNIKKILFIYKIFALLLCIILSSQHRFHGDEALYVTWAMDMAKSTSIYLDRPYLLDKQPILLFLIAFFYSLFPSKETFAYIPNIIAFIISIYVIFLVLYKFYNCIYIGLLGSLLFALTPVNLLFAPTAFMDTLMVCFLLFAFYYLLLEKYFIFGLFLGLALGTKSFAVFYFLFFVVIYIYQKIKEKQSIINIKDMRNILIGFLVIYLPVILWGILNSLKFGKHPLFALAGWWGITGRPESFVFNFENFFIRLKEWLHYYQLIYFSKIINIPIFLIIIINLFVFRDIKDLIIFSLIIINLFQISLSQMPIFDRYIATFAPFIIMLTAVSLVNIFRINTNKKFYLIIIIILIVFLALPIRQGLFKYKIRNYMGQTFGSLYSRNDGIDLIANYLLGKYKTPISICMHRDFSWVMDYYLYRAPEGYWWWHYQPDDKNIEENVKSFAYYLENTDRKIFLLFYADNDEINRFAFFLEQYKLTYELEYETYDRFNKRNIILYSVKNKILHKKTLTK